MRPVEKLVRNVLLFFLFLFPPYITGGGFFRTRSPRPKHFVTLKRVMAELETTEWGNLGLKQPLR